MSESVELATILLTDLVGSTRLATSVGPVRADELREEHFGLLRQAIASTGGQEVKNLGDGLMVAFGSASGAVSCAVAMQQLFERRYGQAEQGLHVRIGLGAGESTVKDGDYFGMPTVEAARLCAQAPADGILISTLVKTLAGRCEGVEFESAGLLELKGLPEPVEAFSVSWAPLGEEASGAGGWPLPALLRSVPPVSYVGRVEERAALEEAMVLARDRARQVVLLSGEPGIGKTRLSSFAAHRAHAEGFAVCWGACSEELAVPYEPWIEVCSQLVEHAPQEVLSRFVDRHKGELGRLARNLERRVADLPEPQTSDPETERYLLFSAVAGLLQEVAQSVPVCVVLDDLHWADGQSVALLKHVVRTVEQGALQVIATYRDSDLGKDHPLSAVLADLRSIEGVQRLALHGLGADEVAQIMTVVAGYELDEDILQLAGQIAAETDGNPFFVGEILRGLWESGALTFDEASGRWSVDRSAAIALPESVREVIERRVERLGDEALEVLTQAAVIGRVFDLELLESILDLDESALLDHLEAAVAASLLAESSERVGQFRFAHTLINQTLYEGLGVTRRARMHQRVAQALEQLYGADPGEHLGELALHWRLAAVSVDKAKAAAYALKAGQQALDNLAPTEAVKYFADAVELVGDADNRERCEALIGLGDAQRQAGDPQYRDTLLGAAALAARIGDADAQARAVLATWRGMSAVGHRDVELVAALEGAAKALPTQDPRRADILAELAAEIASTSPLERRRALADEALTLARVADEPGLLCRVLVQHALAIWVAHTIDERVANLEEARLLADRVGDPALQFLTASRSCNVIEAGDLDGFDVQVARMRELHVVLGQPIMEWVLLFTQAPRAMLEGRFSEAERLATRAFEVSGGTHDGLTIFGAQIAALRYEQGRMHELIDAIAQTVIDNPALPAFIAAHAAAFCSAGDHDHARELLESLAADDFASMPLELSWSGTLALCSEVAFRVGASEAAAALYRLLLPHERTIIWNGCILYGPTARHLGRLALMLERYDEAEAYLAAASAEHERIRAPVWQADTDPLMGLTLLRRPSADADRAGQLLRRAAQTAHEYGAAGIEREAQEALADLAQR